jgi:CRP-like cAMP-binding protein
VVQKNEGFPLSHYRGGNRVLDAIPSSRLHALLARAIVLRLERYTAVTNAGMPFEHADFPLNALLSVVAIFENGQTSEVGALGREGFTPIEPVLHEDIARRTTFCQIPGEVVRIPIEDFRQALADGDEFAVIAGRLVSARLFAAEQMVSCNLTHSISERCARWLLSTSERVGSNTFELTHDFLALMLGVRRAGVSQVAGALQAFGAISYRRGHITVVDEGRLRACACECYSLMRNAFDRAFDGDLSSPAPDAFVSHQSVDAS